MKCVGNNSPKSLGEIERKTYGTGGLISPQAQARKYLEAEPNVDAIFIPAPHTTNGVPVMRDGCMSSLMHSNLPPQF